MNVEFKVVVFWFIFDFEFDFIMVNFVFFLCCSLFKIFCFIEGLYFLRM